MSAPHAYTWNAEVSLYHLVPLLRNVTSLLNTGVPVTDITAGAARVLANADLAAVDALANVIAETLKYLDKNEEPT